MNKPEQPLTPREHQILLEIISGKSSQQIAHSLHISANTIVTHRKNIMRKLNIHSPVGLMHWALKKGINIPL
jgi:DNA-binding CsgD family transcriptional regulator